MRELVVRAVRVVVTGGVGVVAGDDGVVGVGVTPSMAASALGSRGSGSRVGFLSAGRRRRSRVPAIRCATMAAPAPRTRAPSFELSSTTGGSVGRDDLVSSGPALLIFASEE